MSTSTSADLVVEERVEDKLTTETATEPEADPTTTTNNTDTTTTADLDSNSDLDSHRPQNPIEQTPQLEFYTHFLKAQKDLTSKIESLKDVPATDRASAVVEIQREIAEWNGKIADARGFLPGYDLRSYSETLKGLSTTLTKTRDSLSSKPKFSFKSKSIPKPKPKPNSSSSSVPAPPPPTPATPLPTTTTSAGPPLPTDPTDPSALILDSPSSKLLLLPSEPYTALHLTNLTHTLLNHHSHPTPFPSTAAVLRISHSLLLLPPIHGPIHITHATSTLIILPYAHQVRIHDCKDVTVLYSSRSAPVIERCRGMRFGRLPGGWVGRDGQSSVGGVQDFDWLKGGVNPHFEVVEGEVLSEEVCGRIERVKEEGEVEGLLKELGLVE